MRFGVGRFGAVGNRREQVGLQGIDRRALLEFTQLALGRLYLMGFEEMGPDPAEAEAWLSRAAAKGNKEAAALIPQAQAAKKDEQAAYQVREAYRKSWYAWYSGYPYYWVWGPSGWYQR